MSETSRFRTVLRGYDPTQVEQRVGALTEELRASRHQAAELARRLEALESVQAQHQQPPEPTVHDVGPRVGQILSLAEEEAEDLRAEADRYATEKRSSVDSEAAHVLAHARRRASEMLDETDRETTALREEAEAISEAQRARSAQATADLEATLVRRREHAEKESGDRIAAAEEQLAAARRRVEEVEAEGQRRQAEIAATGRRLYEEAAQRAQQVVDEAKEHAGRIRAESERELAAATARRDSINAQLANLRQMLATLTGGTGTGPADAEPGTDPADAEEQEG